MSKRAGDIKAKLSCKVQIDEKLNKKTSQESVHLGCQTGKSAIYQE